MALTTIVFAPPGGTRPTGHDWRGPQPGLRPGVPLCAVGAGDPVGPGPAGGSPGAAPLRWGGPSHFSKGEFRGLCAPASPPGQTARPPRNTLAPADQETITAIIPTKNRPAALHHTLGTVFAQRHPINQLIIVDQSPTCGRQELGQLRVVGPGSPDWIYLHEPWISGGAAARNRAMEFARGTIWLFLDDDVELETGFTAALLAAYRRDRLALGMAGLIINYPRPPWRERGWNAVFRRGLFRDDRQPLYWRAAHLCDPEPLPVSRFTGSAMSFRAAAIAGRRFDARLKGVSNGEDVGFCLGLTGGGPGLFMAPAARLCHLRDPNGRSRAHWVRQTARDAWFLYLSQCRGAAGWPWRERLRLAWLDFGLALGGAVSSMRHRSWAALSARRAGKREALAIVAAGPPA